MKTIILAITIVFFAVGCSSKRVDELANTKAANAICSEKFGPGVSATHYYYTGEARSTAIGLHCGNDPYNQDRIKISRDEWDGKVDSYRN